MLGSGWSVKKIAEALLMDPDSVRAHFKRYQEGGMEALLRHDAGGQSARLNEQQEMELDAHLSEHLYTSAKAVANHVQKTYGIVYSERGITHLLHRLGYTYKKATLIPGKADGEAQIAFLEKYEKLKKNKAEGDPIYFMDATHPHHNPIAGSGWIKRGGTYEIPTNTGRRRLNINGAFNAETLKAVVRFDDTINADSTVALFQRLEREHADAQKIYIICDNARYYRSKVTQEYLKNSRIVLLYLPPYAPNLNLIERYWKFFKKKVLYDSYYETFKEFKNACSDFFLSQKRHIDELRSLMTEKFEIIYS